MALAPDIVVHADPNQIQQIVLNLGTNASHAMSKGGCLRVWVAQAGDQAVLEVTDDGVGMDEQTLAHIFEPFFTTKPEGVGTGLGLPSVRAIVETLAGEIRCESQPDRGTQIVIELPILASPPDVKARPVRASPAQVRLDGYRILVADDEVRVRAMVTTTLQAAGASVVDVGHAEAAIALSERDPKPFDLLWTDVMMPGGGGGSLVAYFAKHSPSTRIVISTGYSDDEVLRQDVALGRYELLRKPFAPAELTRVVARVLHDRERSTGS
jgi:CheY-like chemotaxis protein/anti-sigma regulatory factor (Ser/Thr protein kinase)